jgi:hypothetical protein
LTPPSDPSWLSDYVDVAERIAVFKEAHPEGSLQTLHWEVFPVGERLFVVYRAAAYRGPEDTRPGHGTAWEPFPGSSNYTRDSELMNAETAAWGRAIVAVGITASRKLASKQEVQARSHDQHQEQPYGQPRRPPGPPADSATDAQRKRIHVLLKEKGVTRGELQKYLDPWKIELGEGWMDRLTGGKDGTAGQLIETLRKIEVDGP